MSFYEIVAVSLGFSGVNIVLLLVGVYKLGAAVKAFQIIGHQQANEISELKVSVQRVATVVTEQALQTQRVGILEARVERNANLIDDLRRGEGLIYPLDDVLRKRLYGSSGDK